MVCRVLVLSRWLRCRVSPLSRLLKRNEEKTVQCESLAVTHHLVFFFFFNFAVTLAYTFVQLLTSLSFASLHGIKRHKYSDFCCGSFLCVRVHVRMYVCYNEKKKCQTDGKHHKVKRHQQYLKHVAAITTQRKVQQQQEAHLSSRSLPFLQKKERSNLLNLHMSQSTCFGT